MRSPRCSWVRDRLPLLAGGDLVGPDRRRVESHMVVCPECRRQLVALGQALLALATASASSPSRSDAPSLWPALARQIRESRRPHRGPTFGFSFAPLRMRLWPAFGLGLLAAIGATAVVRNEIAETRADKAVVARPISTPRTTPAVVQRPQDSAPSPDVPTPIVENEPQQFHDDIKPATNAPPESRDSKLSY